MAMKLILLQDVEDLGLAGEEINVAPGYARNFLIPKKLAAQASTAALRKIAAAKEKIEEKRKLDLEAAKALAEKIVAAAITIPVQASDDDHLFGSVSERMIIEAYAKGGIVIEHHRVRLESHIRKLGEYKVDIKLHKEVVVSAKVNVVRA